MKRTLMHLLMGAMMAAGWTVQVSGQDDDPVVTIEPQAETSDSDGIISGGTISGDGYFVDGAYTMGARGLRAAASDRAHPRPIYAHSRRGAEAVWTHEWNQQQAMMRPWHGNYYHRQYGAPLALIVPPTASFQSNWSWGVGRTTSTPIYHQFARPYPGPASGMPHGLHRTPAWPSNTNQFGVYYIRGPW